MFSNFNKYVKKPAEYQCYTTSLQLVHVTKLNRHQSLCWSQIAAHSTMFIVVNVHDLVTGQY